MSMHYFGQLLFYSLALLLSRSCSKEDRSESILTVVNEHLRKVDHTLNIDQHSVAPQAIKCSLKGLVPYDSVRLNEIH